MRTPFKINSFKKRICFTEFEAPKNFEVLTLNASCALLKWTMKIENVEEIFKKVNNFLDKPYLSNKISQSELFKEVSYELYVKEKQIDLISLEGKEQTELKEKIEKHQKSIRNRPFRAFTSDQLNHVKSSDKSKEINSYEETEASFEYNLTSLIPNTKYAFELRARISSLESLSTQLLVLQTSSKLLMLNLFSGLKRIDLLVCAKMYYSVIRMANYPNLVDILKPSKIAVSEFTLNFVILQSFFVIFRKITKLPGIVPVMY